MKEKILFITNLMPFPLDNGGKIKTYNILKLLKPKYDIDLLFFVNSENEIKHLRELEKIGYHIDFELKSIILNKKPLKKALEILRSLCNGKPYIISKYYSKSFSKKVDHYIKHNDYKYIYIDHLQQFQYVPKIFLKTLRNKIILDQHNVEYILAKRYYHKLRNPLKKIIVFLEYLKLRSYEKWACRSVGLVLAITNHDKESLQLLCGSSIRINTSPIYIEAEDAFRYKVNEDNSNKRILFVGTMSWYPNEDGIIWFYHKIFSKLKTAHPDIRLDIVGSNPGNNVRMLGKDSFVTVTGYVDNITSYLERAMLSIVPIRIGGGIRIKILQLLSVGIPIVTTSLGCEGISLTPKKEALVADSERDFLIAINSLISNPMLRKELSLNSINLIREKYSFERASENMCSFLMPN
ncbi:MAG: glycosyltransferase [Tissierellales bacterium]|nr:glycosyltransferase [Tissierellales bacterium]